MKHFHFANCWASPAPPLSHQTSPFRSAWLVLWLFLQQDWLYPWDLDSCSCEPPTIAIFYGPQLSQFEPVTDKLICELVLKSLMKSCMPDPIPTSLTRQCLDDLVSLIMFIVNASLSTGIVPPQFKQAIVTPLLKKPGLNTNDMKKFRPVSNLSFISKILEKVVLIQLKNHLSGNNLIEIFQSAYRQNHSTETAILSVLDGLLCSTDERLVSLVALLDLSAAFDTLDHPVLLKWLETTFGVRGTDLDWFVSYLNGRFQSVIVDGVMSSSRRLVYGVPQGFVLGPVLFTLYSQPLSDVISSIIVTITSTPMTLSYSKVTHLISSFLFTPVFRPVLMMFCSGWISTSLSWTQIRLRLCLLALHLVLSWLTLSVRTLVETVFLSKCRLYTLESILIKCCQCRSTSAASAVHPF